MTAQMSPLMCSALEAAQRELAREFSGVFSQETISRVLEDSYERIGERPRASSSTSRTRKRGEASRRRPGGVRIRSFMRHDYELDRTAGSRGGVL
jgi:hypothetical protein